MVLYFSIHSFVEHLLYTHYVPSLEIQRRIRQMGVPDFSGLKS